jgi:hypothetical protein
MIQLIPAQTAAYRVLRYALNAGDLLLLRSVSGRGRTTVLKKLHEETGGAFVNSKDFIEGSGGRHLTRVAGNFSRLRGRGVARQQKCLCG